MPILGVIASSKLVSTNSYESIATATGTGSSGTITFSSIPSTYKSLQLRFNVRSTTFGSSLSLRYNSDSGSNYAQHTLYANEATITATGSSSTSSNQIAGFVYGIYDSYSTVGVIDIIDYASTTKNKTLKSFSGLSLNVNNEIVLASGLWNSTAAVSSISIFLSAYNFTTNSTISLYGIKG